MLRLPTCSAESALLAAVPDVQKIDRRFCDAQHQSDSSSTPLPAARSRLRTDSGATTDLAANIPKHPSPRTDIDDRRTPIEKSSLESNPPALHFPAANQLASLTRGRTTTPRLAKFLNRQSIPIRYANLAACARPKLIALSSPLEQRTRVTRAKHTDLRANLKSPALSQSSQRDQSSVDRFRTSANARCCANTTSFPPPIATRAPAR